jgi:hypothetical protein
VSPGALLKLLRDHGISAHLDGNGRLRIAPASLVPPKLLEAIRAQRQDIVLHLSFTLGCVHAATGGSELVVQKLPDEFSPMLWGAWRHELPATRHVYDKRAVKDLNKFVLEWVVRYCNPMHFHAAQKALDAALGFIGPEEGGRKSKR